MKLVLGLLLAISVMQSWAAEKQAIPEYSNDQEIELKAEQDLNQDKHNVYKRLIRHFQRTNSLYKNGSVVYASGLFTLNMDIRTRSEAKILYDIIYAGSFKVRNLTYDVSGVTWEIQRGYDRPHFIDKFTNDPIDAELFEVTAAANGVDDKKISFFLKRKKMNVASEVSQHLERIANDAREGFYGISRSRSLVPMSSIGACLNFFTSSRGI